MISLGYTGTLVPSCHWNINCSPNPGPNIISWESACIAKRFMEVVSTSTSSRASITASVSSVPALSNASGRMKRHISVFGRAAALPY